ncbi:hypothetical protein F5Y06DRAFT_19178 [Hypoxylon sp. FL0890]|nr:hypothetical protein F5Y06DRAFT_19178 [Hypoxylon sp. FL0890]
MASQHQAYTEAEIEEYLFYGDDIPFPKARYYIIGFLGAIHILCLGVLFCASQPDLIDEHNEHRPADWEIFVFAFGLWSGSMIQMFFRKASLGGLYGILAWVCLLAILVPFEFEFVKKLLGNTGLFVAWITLFWWIGLALAYNFQFVTRSYLPSSRRGETAASLV